MNGYNGTMRGHRIQRRPTFTFNSNLVDLPAFVGIYAFIKTDFNQII
jgi:hypothetical protein